MKFGTTIAALALIGAGAFATSAALAESKDAKEPPHLLSAPKSSLVKDSKATKSRSFTLEAKAGPNVGVMPPLPPTSDAKNSK